jgi:hypothetical protein
VLIEVSQQFIALTLFQRGILLRISAKKEVGTFSHLHHPYKRITVLECQACFLMLGDLAQGFPPPLVLAQFVGTDNSEDQGGEEGDTTENKYHRAHQVPPYLILKVELKNERAGVRFPEHVTVMPREHAQARKGKGNTLSISSALPSALVGDMPLSIYMYSTYCKRCATPKPWHKSVGKP